MISTSNLQYANNQSRYYDTQIQCKVTSTEPANIVDTGKVPGLDESL